MSKYVDKFFMGSILGSNAKPDNPETVMKACIDRAYRDMMTAGRFYKIGSKKDNCNAIYDKLAGKVFSRSLIEEVMGVFPSEEIHNDKGGRVTAFGLSQKVVNMSFKYFYCFRQFAGLEKMDFANLDCPVDSIILAAMKKRSIIKSNHVWSKLTESEYVIIQNALDDKYKPMEKVVNELDGISKRLMFDFEIWPNA